MRIPNIGYFPTSAEIYPPTGPCGGLDPDLRLGPRDKCENISLTAGVTGKGGNWRKKPPDAESAVGVTSPKVRAKPRTCPVPAVLGSFLIFHF